LTIILNIYIFLAVSLAAECFIKEGYNYSNIELGLSISADIIPDILRTSGITDCRLSGKLKSMVYNSL
jgi:hypothetical protein